MPKPFHSAIKLYVERERLCFLYYINSFTSNMLNLNLQYFVCLMYVVMKNYPFFICGLAGVYFSYSSTVNTTDQKEFNLWQDLDGLLLGLHVSGAPVWPPIRALLIERYEVRQGNICLTKQENIWLILCISSAMRLHRRLLISEYMCSIVMI